MTQSMGGMTQTMGSGTLVQKMGDGDTEGLAISMQRPTRKFTMLSRTADNRCLLDAVEPRDDVLDLTGEDVLAAAHDHVVVAAVDDQPAVGVEPAGVPRADQATQPRLVLTAGVALERQLAADEDAAALAVDHRLTVGIDDGHRDPAQRPAGGARVGAQVRGARHRGRTYLGRAVEVVDDVAVGVLEPLGERGRQRRAPRWRRHATTCCRARRGCPGRARPAAAP